MKREQIETILNSEKLKDISLLDVITVLGVVLESEYDYQNRTGENRSSNTNEVFIIIQ